MIKLHRVVQAPAGTFVLRRRSSGDVRARTCRYWGIWLLHNRQGDLIQCLSEPMSSDTRKLPESMQAGFAGFQYTQLPEDLFID